MYDPQEIEKLRKSLLEWQENSLKETLERLPERQEKFITTSSEPVERLYTPLDTSELDYNEDLGLPGEYPFTRGVHPTLHRSKLWTMRMFAGFGTAEETNQRFKYLLDQGQTGLSVAFDLPTLMGIDSDDARSMGEVGRLGVALDADPRFPFYRISHEIEEVSEGEGRRIDAYLQLKTCPSERLRGKILIDSPGFDADEVDARIIAKGVEDAHGVAAAAENLARCVRRGDSDCRLCGRSAGRHLWPNLFRAWLGQEYVRHRLLFAYEHGSAAPREQERPADHDLLRRSRRSRLCARGVDIHRWRSHPVVAGRVEDH